MLALPRPTLHRSQCLIACAHLSSKHTQYSFAGALHASVHLRDYELAMNLLEEMIDMGMPANSQSYATAIRTCARCSKSDEAVFLYASQLRMAIVPTEVRSSASSTLAASAVPRAIYLRTHWMHVAPACAVALRSCCWCCLILVRGRGVPDGAFACNNVTAVAAVAASVRCLHTSAQC